VGAPASNNSTIDSLTMACHDYIGTYDPFDYGDGLTWPWDMPDGYNFVRDNLGFGCDYRYDWLDLDINSMFEVARDQIINYKNPVIVGYFQDWHYAIGYAIAENRACGWKADSWIRIYPNPSRNPTDKWIFKDGIFAVYGVYDFYPLFQFDRVENPQALEIVVNGPSDANRLFVYTGTAIFDSQGAPTSGWGSCTVSFEVGRVFSSRQFKKAVAMVSLANIEDDGKAENAGWAINEVDVQLASSGRPQLTLHCALRDVDAHLYRASYRLYVLARLVEPMKAPVHQHLSDTVTGPQVPTRRDNSRPKS
jgi:hypothetical protein